MIITYGEVEFQCRGEHPNGVDYKDIDTAYQVPITMINIVGEWDDNLRRMWGNRECFSTPSQ